MSYFARLGGRPSRRRPAPSRYDLEVLEVRALLSGAGASHGQLTSQTTLYTSMSTAVTGAEVTFGAVVQNAATGAPLNSGFVTFVELSPQKTALGVVKVTKEGDAGLTTDELTELKDYQVVAKYTPTAPKVTASQSAVSTVNVIRQPLHVPTRITLEPGAPRAESGQLVPLLAVIKDAGTGNQVDAGKVQEISGTIQFYTDSPGHTILASVPLNQAKSTAATSGIIQDIQSAIGVSGSSATTVKPKHEILIETDLLRQVGPYRIQARFIPDNDYFAASTSASETVQVTPRTRNAPTVTSLQASSNQIETGEAVTLTATVQNPSSTLAGGYVKLIKEGAHPEFLGELTVTAFDQPISLTTTKLSKVGLNQVKAVYVPGNSLFAGSTSTPAAVDVTPLTAARFVVRPVVGPGEVREPMSFTVTAVNSQGQRVTDYTGTVVIRSPTDSIPNFPLSVYSELQIAPPTAATPDLATIPTTSYTFTAADQGSHTFTDDVQFGKGGAESIRVRQANDSKVYGQTVFAIA